MPRTLAPRKPLLFSDPNNEAIRAVDQVTFHRSASSHLDMICCAHVAAAVDDSNVATESVVTARLRMDLKMVRAMLDGLAKQLAMSEATKPSVN